ncbi:MAG: hypothetical protein DLM70_08925, partial [Chloroflexi bacterium]
PRITPLWFLWENGAFYMTSERGKRHLEDLKRDLHASVCIDTEEKDAVDGIRKNRQVKGRGLADLSVDAGGTLTKRITLKYVPGVDGMALALQRASVPRITIEVRPRRLLGLGVG